MYGPHDRGTQHQHVSEGGRAEITVAREERHTYDRGRGSEQELSRHSPSRYDGVEHRGEHDRQADDQSGVGRRGVSDSEGFEPEHGRKQHPENDTHSQFRASHPLPSRGNDDEHDRGGEQHAHRKQCHHGVGRDQLLGHEVG